MQWKFSGNKPVYVQIMEHIRYAVLVGTFLPGSQVPAVRDWAAEAKVNPNTMQRALSELEQEGLLISRGTTGRYVTSDPGVLEDMKNMTINAVIRASAEKYRALGLSMEQAAALLLALDKEA